jgi:hypothetical protein
VKSPPSSRSIPITSIRIRSYRAPWACIHFTPSRRSRSTPAWPSASSGVPNLVPGPCLDLADDERLPLLRDDADLSVLAPPVTVEDAEPALGQVVHCCLLALPGEFLCGCHEHSLRLAGGGVPPGGRRKRHETGSESAYRAPGRQGKPCGSRSPVARATAWRILTAGREAPCNESEESQRGTWRQPTG